MYSPSPPDGTRRRAGRPRRRRLPSATALVGALACAGVLAGCGTTTSRREATEPPYHEQRSRALAATDPSPSLGRFAGYIWYGDVHSVQASWTVPRVLPGSELGEAGTWIGAQAPGWQEDTPFIQVGTNEGRFASPNGARDDDAYWAFWSDTRHHFLPITLFPVSAGDRIDAALALRDGQWMISIEDRTSRTSVTYSTSDEAQTSFAMGEWTQEDVGTVRRPGPYPPLSQLTVSGLRANGSAPDHRQLESVWMSSNRGTLAPTRLARDSFTLRPVELGAVGMRYLSIAAPENQAYRTFVWQIEHWAPGTSTHQILSSQAAFGEVLQASLTALSNTPWPSAARRPIDRLIAQTQALWAITTSGEAAFPGGLARWKAGWFRQLSQLSSSANDVRTALQLPTGASG